MTFSEKLDFLIKDMRKCLQLYSMHLKLAFFHKVMNNSPLMKIINFSLQVFLDFRGFDFRNFRFNAVYNSILFSSPLVLLGNLDLRSFCLPCFFMCPHINSVNRGMPVYHVIITPSKIIKELLKDIFEY